MHASTRAKALRSLDNMATIVAKEMLIKGDYVNDEVDDTLKSQGAICGGHKYCAIGSLWAGFGVKPQRQAFEWGDVVFSLPGTTGAEREGFLAERPALRIAYDALNEAAEDFIAARQIPEYLLDRDQFSAAIEALFEGAYADDEWEYEHDSDEQDYGVGSPELLSIIEDAKARVQAAA